MSAIRINAAASHITDPHCSISLSLNIIPPAMDPVHTAATTRSPSPAVDAHSLDERHSVGHPSSEKSLGHALSNKAASHDGESTPRPSTHRR